MKYIPELKESLIPGTEGTTASAMTPLGLKELLESLEPTILYYGECPIDSGTIIYVKKGKLHPEYIMVNPVDLKRVKELISWRRFVNLREYVPDYTMFAQPIDI